MNVELLAKVLDRIEREPHRWNQDNWVNPAEEPCKTSMCLAGHALIESGEYVLGTRAEATTYYAPWEHKVHTTVHKETDFYNLSALKFITDLARDDARQRNYGDDGPTPWRVEAEGARLLGIKQDTANTLFLSSVGRSEITRNPDAFRCFVVKTLLAYNEIDVNEAMSLLTLKYVPFLEGEDNDLKGNENEEPPF